MGSSAPLGNINEQKILFSWSLYFRGEGKQLVDKCYRKKEKEGGWEAAVLDRKHKSIICLFATPWTVVHQVPLSRDFPARILEWIAISYSRGTSWVMDQTLISCIAERFFTADPPGIPGFPTGSEWRIFLQCRRWGFNPWVGMIPWSRKWQPTPVFLAVKAHGQKSLGAPVHVRQDLATKPPPSPGKPLDGKQAF